MLNLYPYNNAHVMVAPYRHVKGLEFLKTEELLDVMQLVNYTKVKIEKKLKPHGFNIGMNAGKIAGAGFADHLHMHIVPRWNGDTNFMPVLADTRCVPEAIEKTAEFLRNTWENEIEKSRM